MTRRIGRGVPVLLAFPLIFVTSASAFAAGGGAVVTRAADARAMAPFQAPRQVELAEGTQLAAYSAFDGSPLELPTPATPRSSMGSGKPAAASTTASPAAAKPAREAGTAKGTHAATSVHNQPSASPHGHSGAVTAPTASSAGGTATGAAGAKSATGPAKPHLPTLDANAVLAKYEDRLAAQRLPAISSFEYSVEQAGEHGLSQTHRIYRENALVRDETIAIDAQRVKPKVRIFRNRPDPYVAAIIAPRRADYDFTLTGVRHNGSHLDYSFKTTPHLKRAFTVTSVVIDGLRDLPTMLEFSADGPMVSGEGTLRYGPVNHAWVIIEAIAHGNAGKRELREHLVFTDYSFPKSLPATTFGGALP